MKYKSNNIKENDIFRNKNNPQKDLNCKEIVVKEFNKKKQKKTSLNYLFKYSKRIKLVYIKTTIIDIIIKYLFFYVFANASNVFNSYIILKMRGIGEFSIYSETYTNTPDVIIINNKTIEEKINKYNFKQFDNSVKLIWYSTITSCLSLFSGCSNIYEIDLSNFNTSKVSDISYMFNGCKQLYSLDISFLDVSKVRDIRYLFKGCSSLTYINMSNFRAGSLNYISYAFQSCTKLRSLDLSNFNTSKIISLRGLFEGCSSLTFLNLSNFDTSHVTRMQSIFCNCSSLISIDLSSFNTSNVGNMDNMFFGCSSLNYLNLSNFDISKVSRMNNIFNGCKSLKYINLRNFHNNKGIDDTISNIFANMNDNIVICYNNIKENDIIFSKIKNKPCFVIDCSNDWASIQNYIKNELDKYLLCESVSLNNILCKKCKDNY